MSQMVNDLDIRNTVWCAGIEDSCAVNVREWWNGSLNVVAVVAVTVLGFIVVLTFMEGWHETMAFIFGGTGDDILFHHLI